MKRALVCGAALIALWDAPARADIVSDPLVEANTLQSVISETVAATRRVAMINNQLIQIENLIQTVQAVAHGNLAALASLSPELGALGLTSPLGTDTVALVQSLTGLATNLGVSAELGQQILSSDRYYGPTGTDFRAIAMNQIAIALANQKAIAQTALNSNTQRLASLTTLRNSLSSTADIKAAADAGARLQGETATSAAQTNQLLAAQMMATAQTATTQAREEQAWRCSADSFVAKVRAAEADATAGNVTLIGTSSSTGINCQPATGSTSSITISTTVTTTDTTAAVTPTDALGIMMAQSWGQTAANNATALGVNPNALAATCVLESGCSTAVGGSGTISGAFQMSNGTEAGALAAATALNPALASQISSNKNDPATQSIAASQYLLQGAQSLQNANVPNPTVLDVRGYYQFGPANAASVATAADNQLMAPLLTGLSSTALAGNNITSTTTVGQWRASVTSKLGSAASQPVLLGA